MRSMILVVMLAGCASTGRGGGLDEPVSVDSGYLLTNGDVRRFQALAEKGDAQAAFRLSLHFKRGTSEALSWQQRAAHLGHPTAQYNEWFRLSGEDDCESLKEALSWLESAAKSGIDVTWEMDRFKPRVNDCFQNAMDNESE